MVGGRAWWGCRPGLNSEFLGVKPEIFVNKTVSLNCILGETKG